MHNLMHCCNMSSVHCSHLGLSSFKGFMFYSVPLFTRLVLCFTEAKKEVSVVIIKPDAVQSGKAEEIMGEVYAPKEIFPADFFKINFFVKFFQEYAHAEGQPVWIQIMPDRLSGLIWFQTVCKIYQLEQYQSVKQFGSRSGLTFCLP